MDLVSQFSEWGYIGLFIASFIAGSAVPFCSEAVLALLMATGFDSLLLLLFATTGNFLGGTTCYYLGHLGRLEWIEKYLKIKPEKLEKAMKFVRKGPGGMMAFLSFLPAGGTVIVVALGYMRANLWVTNISMLLGKFLRYYCVVEGVKFFI